MDRSELRRSATARAAVIAAGLSLAISAAGEAEPLGITAANVSQLKPAFSFRTGNPQGHAGAPAVIGDTMFVLTPFPHTLFALDLSRPGAPVKWRFVPEAHGSAEGLACCDTINAGPVVADGKVYFNSLDGHTIALDAASGKPVWNVRTVSLDVAETLTAAPLIADGKVFVGNSGDDFGARGWIAALDAQSGHELWRRFSTGPDGEVGIGPGFQPFYARDQGQNLGVASWPPSGWQHGGGSVSGTILYDPALHLLFHGTGHPAPWNPDQHEGDNKWTSGLFARDPEDGAAKWFDQIDPHDLFALGSTEPGLAIDRDWHGTARHLLIHPDPDGYVYVIDRTNGQVLSAAPFTKVNATRGVNLATGELRQESNRASRFGTMTRDVCPGWPGATGAHSALSADRRLLFIPVSRLCMDMEARNVSYMAGTAVVGANVRAKSPADGLRGALVAWDIEAARPVWTVPEPFPLAGGVLALGGAVFYGTLDGWFKAVDAGTGRTLWQFHAASGIIGDPIAYRGPDGQPYVAVLAGLGGSFGMVAKHGIDERDATAANGLANALQDLPEPSDPSGTLYAFGLP
jgi:PQQ-dependent dehydrogenase (methanol/ethanol family)